MSENIKDPKNISAIEDYILNSIQQIKFGAVEIIIHDSKIVQVEKSEKVRFSSAS